MTCNNQTSNLTTEPQRAEATFREHSFAIARRRDRLLQWLLILQWLAGIIGAVCISPKAWDGTSSHIGPHIWAAILLGGIISSLPVILGLRWPGSALSRHTIAADQIIHEMHKIAERQALLESVNERIERTVVERTAELTSEITERKRAEKSLRLLKMAVDQSKDSVMITDAELDLPGPRIVFVNPAYTKMTGYTAEESIGLTPRVLQGPRTDRSTLKQLRQNLEKGEEFAGEAINYRKDGKPFHLEWQIAPIRDVEGITTHFVAIQRDITERKRLATRWSQSQKLETLGRLAGGFAHEFNTILTSIIGQSELVFAALPPGSALAKNTGEIRACASRAAKLTRQLLAYGRKQMLQPEMLNLNTLLSGMQRVIAEITGSRIAVEFNPDESLYSIRADAAQIEEVVTHVVSNARDAMPEGGKLTLETSNLIIGENPMDEYDGMKAGQYVVLAFTDTGVGMSVETKAHAFDPFYSTKGVGKGTGLGLATCYGIIKQSGGYLQLESEIAVGSTLKIYLPKTITKTPAITSETGSDLESAFRKRSGTILIVDSDATFCDLATLVLEKLGYEILSATDQDKALDLAERAPRIDLLLAGVGEAVFSGKALAAKIRSIHPAMRILFTSSRHDDVATHTHSSDGATYFIRKPFTPALLGSEIRYILKGIESFSAAGA